MEAQPDQIFAAAPADWKPGPVTPGMDRQQAIATDGMWAGFVRTEAGMVSGWHHHGEYETAIYVLTGALKMEFGPDGANTVEAGPSEFVYVPKGSIHPGEQSLRGTGRHYRHASRHGGVDVQRRRSTPVLTGTARVAFVAGGSDEAFLYQADAIGGDEVPLAGPADDTRPALQLMSFDEPSGPLADQRVEMALDRCQRRGGDGMDDDRHQQFH